MTFNQLFLNVLMSSASLAFVFLIFCAWLREREMNQFLKMSMKNSEINAKRWADPNHWSNKNAKSE